MKNLAYLSLALCFSLFFQGCQAQPQKFYYVKITTDARSYKIGDDIFVTIENLSEGPIVLESCKGLQKKYILEKNEDGFWIKAYESGCDILEREYVNIEAQQKKSFFFALVVDPDRVSRIAGEYRLRFIIAASQTLKDEFKISNTFEIKEQ